MIADKIKSIENTMRRTRVDYVRCIYAYCCNTYFALGETSVICGKRKFWTSRKIMKSSVEIALRQSKNYCSENS